jgi:hypothetical protein
MGTYKCWKCKRVGHLPEDCTAFLGVAAPSPDNPNELSTSLPPHLAAGGDPSGGIYSPDLKRLYLPSPSPSHPKAYFLNFSLTPRDTKNARIITFHWAAERNNARTTDPPCCPVAPNTAMVLADMMKNNYYY